jgi:hypothetical protein
MDKSCFLQSKYITYYVQNITLLKKRELLLFFWWSGGVPSACRSRDGAALDAGHHDIRCLLHSFPCGGRRCSNGANQDWSQQNGGVVALEAGKDVLCYRLGNHSPFGLQEVADGGLHASQSLGDEVQHREDGAKRRRGPGDLDGT